MPPCHLDALTNPGRAATGWTHTGLCHPIAAATRRRDLRPPRITMHCPCSALLGLCRALRHLAFAAPGIARPLPRHASPGLCSAFAGPCLAWPLPCFALLCCAAARPCQTPHRPCHALLRSALPLRRVARLGPSGVMQRRPPVSPAQIGRHGNGPRRCSAIARARAVRRIPATRPKQATGRA